MTLQDVFSFRSSSPLDASISVHSGVTTDRIAAEGPYHLERSSDHEADGAVDRARNSVGMPYVPAKVFTLLPRL